MYMLRRINAYLTSKNENKKNTYGIRTLNLPVKKTWLSSVRNTLAMPPPVLPLCVLIAYANKLHGW